jgi:hypothetical protein
VNAGGFTAEWKIINLGGKGKQNFRTTAQVGNDPMSGGWVCCFSAQAGGSRGWRIEDRG